MKMKRLLLALAVVGLNAVLGAGTLPDETCDVLVAAGGALAAPARKVMNVVNFVRALDPRMPKAEYVRALDEEVKLNRKYGFANTELLQYDALVDAEMLATARKSDLANG